MTRVLLSGAELLDPEAQGPSHASLLVEGGRILARLPPQAPAPGDALRCDLAGLALAPGFLDIHHHGRVIFSDADRLEEALFHDARVLARHGTTAFLVTTVSLEHAALAEATARIAERIGSWRRADGCAEPLGLHLEGPWISAEASGAHLRAGVRGFDAAEGEDLLARAAGAIRMVTLAPELPGSDSLLARLGRAGIVAALGHSVASADVVTRAMTQGARHVTHLFNAMGPLHHRSPGLAGAALSEPGLTCDLICDGVHVEARMVAIAARCKGDRLVLITDRLDPIDGAPGPLASGRLEDDGRAFRLPDGRLAGSRLDLPVAISNAQRMGGMTRLEAVAACTLRPARLLGIESERGTLRPGARADFAVLDTRGRVVETWIAGERVFRAEVEA